jgi:hypothetical protein
MTGNIGGDSRISVFNIMVQEIHQTKSTGPETELNISPLKDGVYLIRVTHEKGLVSVGRFVKR